MKIGQFLQEFHHVLTEYERCAFRDFSFPYEVTPHGYLKEAEDSLTRMSQGGDRDAVANAKRGIDCQIEAVIETLGLQTSGGFPSRVSAIRKLGLVAPRILEKINKLRNSIEHDFVNPSREQAEMAVDTALLFVELTHRIFRQMVLQCAIYDPTPKMEHWIDWGPNYLVFELKGEAEAFEVRGSIEGRASILQVVKRSDPEFVPLLRFFLAGDFAYSDLPDGELIEQLRQDLNDI
ncbi:hypothetical protein [Rugamonas rivuli]|uniref:DUF4145 domain-containing protein n=1 Tax=Rugamonas rivuli TaxID=2743358 RepID=A0A843SGL0_9BURK|nr:hypothetical protein [Rugamonas rivuli]MQA21154.1 hypothetical protein [Rugamonas rivuli]